MAEIGSFEKGRIGERLLVSFKAVAVYCQSRSATQTDVRQTHTFTASWRFSSEELAKVKGSMVQSNRTLAC